MVPSPGDASRIPEWRVFVPLALIVYCFVLFMHVQGFSSLDALWRGQEDPARWNTAMNQVDGEFILGTHDAYRWAAGAEGVGSGRGEAPSVFLAGLSRLSGVSPAGLAFWSPLFFAGLTAVVAALWAWTLGGVEAALAAGILAGLAPGFFFRSRLGYFDTDVVTLLGPLFITWALAQWLKTRLHPHILSALAEDRRLGWFSSRARKAAPAQHATEDRSGEPGGPWGLAGSASLAAMTATGLAARYFGIWHPYVQTFLMLALVLALALVLLLARAGTRPHCLWGLLAFGLAAFLGWIGLAAALAMTALRGLPGKAVPAWLRKAWVPLFGLVVVMAFMGGPRAVVERVQHFTQTYSKPTAQVEQSRGPASGQGDVERPEYPGVDQSIIEAQNVDVAGMFFKLHPWVWVAAVGLLGFLGCLILDHRLVLILPLAVLSLLAWKYGTRTAMFGGPAVALGLSLPYCLALGRQPGAKDRAVPLLVWLGLALAGAVLYSLDFDPLWLAVGCFVFGGLFAFPVCRLVDGNKRVFALSALSLAAVAALTALGALCLFLLRRAETAAFLYGLLAAAMGAAMPLSWLLNKRLAGKALRRALLIPGMVLLTAALVIPYCRQYPFLAPTPVLAKYHGLALKEFRNFAPEHCMIWTWWDWGYATNYYARRDSFGDGARHRGEIILPLGLVLSTPSPLQARQLMLFSAMNNNSPGTAWADMSATELKGFLDSLALEDMGYTAPEPQYLVLTLENVKLLPWIAYFGLWDVVSGESEHPGLYRLRPGDVEVNTDQGVLRDLPTGNLYPFETLDLLDWNNKERRHYPENPNNMHLVVVKVTGDAWMMGPVAFDSMMVRMLFCPTDDAEVTRQFELVLDLSPLLRIWRARDAAEVPAGETPSGIQRDQSWW